MNLPDERDLPAFVVSFSAPRTSLYAVLIPVINEGERILKQLAGMREADLGLDVIIADGGSNDGSLEPKRLASKLGVHTLLVKTGPGKLSAQLRMGLAHCMREGYRGVVTIDGNGKDDYRAITRFARRLEEGYGFVQGSRYIEGGIAENTPLDRKLAVKLLHAPLISLAAGFRYTDTTNGFRAFSAELLLDPGVRPFRAIFDAYNLHYYLSVRAPRLGFRVCEIPVARRYPQAGPTPSKIAGLRARLSVLRQTILAAAGSYDPDP